MTKDFLIGEDGDWKITDGDVVLVDNASFIRQRWLQRVRTHKGEWVLNVEEGVDYLNEVYTKPNLRRVEAVFRKLTVATPEVLSVSTVEATWTDKKNRIIEVKVFATIEGPEDFVFHYRGDATPEDICVPDFPKKADGLVAWIDAQDQANSFYSGSSTTANNKAAAGSALGNCFMAGPSPLNNKRAFGFSGVGQYLNVIDTPAIRNGREDWTSFLVFYNDATAEGDYGICTLKGVTYSGDLDYFVFYINLNGGVASLNVMSKGEGVAGTIAQATITSPNEPKLLSVTLNGGYLSAAINGTPLVFGTMGLFPVRELDGDIILGSSMLDSGARTDYFEGYIGELLLYNEALSTEDLNSVTFCLARKWGINLAAFEANVGYAYFPYMISAYGL